MAILKTSDIKKMTQKEREDRLQQLKTEIVKANVSANKTSAKTKEIKRAIARLKTFSPAKAEMKTKK